MQQNVGEFQCSDCGADVVEGARICPSCKAPLDWDDERLKRSSILRKENASSGKSTWVWLSITDAASAQKVSRQGFWACGICACETLLFIILSLSGLRMLGIDQWALFDVACYAIIGWGIYRLSRTAAILGLVLYAAEQIVLRSDYSAPIGIGVMIVMLIGFVNGIRGTFAFHKFKAETGTIPPA